MSYNILSVSFLFNHPKLKGYRQDLRKNQTDAERLLWFNLRNRRLLGYKFFRQFGIGNFILDFYCPLKKLAIELDGSQHMEEKHARYDQQRTEFLKQQGIHVLRFWDTEALTNIEGILERIAAILVLPDSR